MRLPPLLLCAALLLPGLGWAQESTPTGGAPLPPPPLVPAASEDVPSEDAPPEEPPRWVTPESATEDVHLLPESPFTSMGRVSAELIGGAAGGAAGALLGGLSGLIAADSVSCGFTECSEANLLVIGTVGLGLSVGAAAGVLGGGLVMDGQGSFLMALSGALLSEAIVGGFILAGIDGSESVLAFFLAPLVGAIAGYEISHFLALEAMKTEGSGITLSPLVSAAPGGGMLGLRGRF
ncbi:hypothetical protein P2318_27575 [Myxococcaceae bacterium GXIMD 01537]